MPSYGKYHTKPQDKRFVKEFVKHGNAGLAAREAYPVNRKSSYAVGHRKLTMPNIQAMINQALVDEKLDPAYVIHTRKVMIEKGMSRLDDVSITPADINKSLDGLERLMGLTGQKEQYQSHIHLYNAPTHEVIDYRDKQTKYFDQIMEGVSHK